MKLPGKDDSAKRIITVGGGKGGVGKSIVASNLSLAIAEAGSRDILVDWRPKAGIRLSPHFYNRIEECDFALEQMDEILRTRAWEKHVPAVSNA